MLCFVDARIRQQRLQASWLNEVRTALVEVATYLFELGIHQCLHATNMKAEPTQLWTKTGKKVDMQRARKIQLLNHIDNCFGSRETLFMCMKDKGTSAMVNTIMNELYLKQAVVLFEGARAIAVQWDAATYAGLNVNIGMCMRLDTGQAAHMLPQVPHNWQT